MQAQASSQEVCCVLPQFAYWPDHFFSESIEKLLCPQNTDCRRTFLKKIIHFTSTGYISAYFSFAELDTKEKSAGSKQEHIWARKRDNLVEFSEISRKLAGKYVTTDFLAPLTYLFTYFEPENMPVNELYVAKKNRSAVFEAPNVKRSVGTHQLVTDLLTLSNCCQAEMPRKW